MVPLVACNCDHHSGIVSTTSMSQVKIRCFLALQIIIAASLKTCSEFVGTRCYCVVQYASCSFQYRVRFCDRNHILSMCGMTLQRKYLPHSLMQSLYCSSSMMVNYPSLYFRMRKEFYLFLLGQEKGVCLCPFLCCYQKLGGVVAVGACSLPCHPYGLSCLCLCPCLILWNALYSCIVECSLPVDHLDPQYQFLHSLSNVETF